MRNKEFEAPDGKSLIWKMEENRWRLWTSNPCIAKKIRRWSEVVESAFVLNAQEYYFDISDKLLKRALELIGIKQKKDPRRVALGKKYGKNNLTPFRKVTNDIIGYIFT